MELRKLQKIAVAALADIKAEDIEVIDTKKLTAMFDRIVIASGGSNRQVKALARNVHDKVKEAGGVIYGMEGDDTGEWVLVDLGDIVVHVMQPAVRAYYNLEELWQAAPKRAADEAAAPATKKAAPKKAVTRKAVTADLATKSKTSAVAAKKAAAKPATKRKATESKS